MRPRKQNASRLNADDVMLSSTVMKASDTSLNIKVVLKNIHQRVETLGPNHRQRGGALWALLRSLSCG